MTWTTRLRVAWVALTLLYGALLWWAPRIWRLGVLVALSAAFLGVDIARNERPLEDPDALRRERVDLADLAREGVRRWRSTKRRWLARDLQEVPVDADRQALIVALDALIENAVQATRPEETIEVSVTGVGRMARLAVTDSGRGLDGEPVDGLFEPFARADQARVRDQDRFGLGLALVRAVVQAHDGHVQASRGRRVAAPSRSGSRSPDLPCTTAPRAAFRG